MRKNVRNIPQSICDKFPFRTKKDFICVECRKKLSRGQTTSVSIITANNYFNINADEIDIDFDTDSSFLSDVEMLNVGKRQAILSLNNLLRILGGEEIDFP